MITHIVSDWLFSPCCVEHQDEFIFERVAVAYSRDYNEVGRAQIKQPRKSGNTVFSIIILSVAMGTSSRIKLSYMSSLPASMKWIQSRIDKKTWQHRFSHYKSMAIFSDAQG